MKTNQSSRLPGQYLAALRTYFEQGTAATLVSARALGLRAVKSGLETLDLAKIHALALAALVLPDSSAAHRADMTSRGALFFAEAVVPIEQTHRIVTDAAARLSKFCATLAAQTLALAESQREIGREVEARKSGEAQLKSRSETFAELLRNARTLEEQLRDTAHALISASEVEKKLVSVRLQDEIAQTLLGINMRLLALKGEVTAGHERINSEIEKTRHLVESSLKSVELFAHTLGIHHAH